MKNYFESLKSVPLFFGIEESDLASLLNCLSAKVNYYKTNETVFSFGDEAKFVGIVLCGKVQIIKDDFYGNRNILATVEKGHLFGEAFACADIKHLPISAIVTQEAEIMLIDYRKIITTCPHSCSFHSKLIFNMMKVVANKNILLNHKIEFLSKRTTKEKLMAYLSYEAKKAHSNSFSIPLNRQELADFLCVDRSAMSNELCKLRDDGILKFQKNQFTLL